ncbi:MAG: aminotransferase class I/II-fold pyridoxal phosphate-dependent enzyme, partial [Chloroflexota bacterium]
PVDSTNGLLPTLAGVKTALEAGHKLFYLESPVRLTGQAFNESEVSALASLFKEHDATVIWDQGMSPWMDQAAYFPLASHPDMNKQVTLIGEAWPGSGIEHMFLGYIASSPAWMPQMTKQKQIMAICTSTASQYAGLAAANLYTEQHTEQLERLAQTKKAVIDLLSPAYGTTAIFNNSTASVLALSLSEDEKSKCISRLQSAGIGYADGKDFGDDSIIRIAMTFDDVAITACQQLVEGL